MFECGQREKQQKIDRMEETAELVPQPRRKEEKIEVEEEDLELVPRHRPVRKFSDPGFLGLTRYIVDIEDCGPISVYLQGVELEKGRDGPVFLTLHDVGSSFYSMADFVNDGAMAEIKSRSMFLHVSIYGQSHKADDLTQEFPSLQSISLGLVSVLDHLNIRNVVVIGDGVGAHIALRFGLYHPTRTQGLVLMNASAVEQSSSVMDKILDKLMKKPLNMDEPLLNRKNIKQYAEAFKNRTSIIEDITDRVNFDVLLFAGAKSSFLEDTEEIFKKIRADKASFIKVDDVEDPIKDAPEKISDPIILFCQGLGWIPTAKLKLTPTSNHYSVKLDDGTRPPMTRRISMEQYDIPNIRRLSLTQQ